ncbi:MAG: DNA polymerase I [Alphaproteobacteria bacterium]
MTSQTAQPQNPDASADSNAIESANTPPNENELYLVDGSGFIFRAYFAMAYSRQKTMTNPAGIPVNAVFGFTNMLLKLLNDYHAPYMAVIFDAARKNFRNDIYPEYKANRDAPPEDLIPQFALVRQATEAFDIPAIELEGYEADDLIATYARLATEQGKKVVIVSSDKDLMQLMNENIRVLDPMKGKFMAQSDVLEKFGVPPERVVDVQALAGDSVDNVPGVPGIGVKTAAQLINEYGTLEELLDRASEIKQQKRRESLIEHRDKALMSKKLVALDHYAPVPLDLNSLKTHDPEKPKLMAFLQEQAFNSIITRLGGEPVTISAHHGDMAAHVNDTDTNAQNAGQNQDSGSGSDSATDSATYTEPEKLPPIKDNHYVLINDEQTLRAWMDEALEAGILAIDTETTSLTPAKAELVGISLAITAGRAAYIPIGHKTAQADLLGELTANAHEDIPQLALETVVNIIKPVLEDESVLKIGHNMKYDWQMFKQIGIDVHPCDDTMLLSYVLDGTTHSNGMDNLSELYFGHSPIKYEEVVGKGKNQIRFDQVDISKALDYAAEDADITLRLHKVLKPRLAREKMVSVYEDIERPLIPVIGRMELTGIKVDRVILKEMSSEFEKKLQILEQDIHSLAGTSFNVASPKQIGEILFDQMGLKGGKKTKTGDWSTSVDVLETLAEDGHEIVAKILEWRSLAKLKSTYTDALQNDINPKTGRVHTSFAMAHVNTGRLSSSDPNLQNIPIRTEEGRKIRTAFIAEKDHVLISVDYSQVELRLAAQMAGIEALKKAFQDGKDIHAITAAQVFGMALEEVTPEIRRQAKAVNFGIIYGISGFGLAKQLGTDNRTAADFIKRYLDRFSELAAFMEAKKQEARDHGFVKTFHGRKCIIKGINEKNGAMRNFAERQAINAPLQGTAADIMKIAMGRMESALQQAGLSAKMLLQVHDELIFEAPQAEADKTKDVIRNVMESITADLFDVPLSAEAGSGASWADAH